MAILAVGDIHGNLPALLDVVAQLHPELSEEDSVVFLGDDIYRGPASRCPVVCLHGNHEVDAADERRFPSPLVVDVDAMHSRPFAVIRKALNAPVDR